MPEELEELKQQTRRGELSARKMKRAQILMLAHGEHPDKTIAQMLHTGISTVCSGFSNPSLTGDT